MSYFLFNFLLLLSPYSYEKVFQSSSNTNKFETKQTIVSANNSVLSFVVDVFDK